MSLTLPSDLAGQEPDQPALALHPGKTAAHLGKVGVHLWNIPAHLGKMAAHLGKVGAHHGKEFNGIKLAFDLGTAGMQTDTDLRPHYTLNWMPAPGQSAVIKVHIRYLYKGEEYGNWREWHT